MPLTDAGKKTLRNMVGQYGPEKGKSVFYASINSGKLDADKMHNSPVPKKSPMHPGFKSVQSKIAKQQGVSEDRAGAILASKTRGASARAKARNPRLKRV